MQIVTDALNQKFGWSLPGCGSTHWAAVHGGHANVSFVAPDTATFRAAICYPDDRLFPPGIRLPLHMPDAKHVWSLHLPEFKCVGAWVSGRAHIDRADPDRDVVGIAEHIGWDFIVGRFRSDLDPRRY